MSDDDDDFMRDMTGGDGGDGETPKLVVGARAVNSIELELRERVYLEQQFALTVDQVTFTEDDTDEAERTYVAAQIALAEIEQAPAREKWRPLIEIARSLGPTGTKEQYEAACAELGVEPWPTK